MARRSKLLKQHVAAIGLLLLVIAGPVAAQTQTFNFTSTVGGNTGSFYDWNNDGNWTPGPFPNAVDAAAVFNVAGNPGLFVNLNQPITLGSLTINNPPGGNTVALQLDANNPNPAGDSITFSSSVDSASWINAVSSPLKPNQGANTLIPIPVILASNLTLEQDNRVGNNNGEVLTAALSSTTSNVTLTKTGNANFTMTTASPNFTGSMVISAGAIQVQGNVLGGTSAITVNSGGQFQIGVGPANFNMAPGAVLSLNGVGKPTTVTYAGTPGTSTANPIGALNYSDGANSTNFNNPVQLQTDSKIYVAAAAPPATVGTITLTQAVSGPGGLTKDGPGTLVLATGNTYGNSGDGTSVIAGTLQVTNTSGSATGVGPVALSAGTTLTGTGTVTGSVTSTGATLSPGVGAPGTLTLGATSLDSASSLNYQLATPGTIGGGVNSLTEVSGNLTLGGTLNVAGLTGFGVGAYRLLDYTGSLTNNGLAIGTLPAGFSGSVIQTSQAGQVNLDVITVPGDVNGDHVVNGLDIALIASHWLQSGFSAPGDANFDNVVNGLDIALVASHWLQSGGGGGTVAGTAAAVPEPGSMGLMAMGLILSLRCVRRRQRAG